MKIIILSITTLLILSNICSAQYMNWSSDNGEKRNNVFVNFGYDYGLTLDVGYNRSMNLFTKPVLLGLDYSMPMGENLLDDYKIKIGGEIELLHKKAFSISTRIKGIIRRYENDYVSIENFGSDLGLTAGFYKPIWYLAGEFGFDKAITSQLKHTKLYKEIYPQVQDGWYTPTGGQLYFGVLTGFSLKELVDISFKLGFTNAQKQDENALLPYYAQIGLNKSF